ncbi:MAG: energy transducer TonB [Muribaculaceae bacterium]|nr:energy transducer TonB [Muribaculaceae bacterium]
MPIILAIVGVIGVLGVVIIGVVGFIGYKYYTDLKNNQYDEIQTAMTSNSDIYADEEIESADMFDYETAIADTAVMLEEMMPEQAYQETVVETGEYSAPETDRITEVVTEEITTANDYPDDHVFQSVDQMPQFPGGDIELMKYISYHIQYPTGAMENNIQGRVVVMFVVTKNGSIGEVKVYRSRDKDLDAEAVRVVKSLPNFIPGKMNGEPVNVWYTLPITFKLR